MFGTRSMMSCPRLFCSTLPVPSFVQLQPFPPHVHALRYSCRRHQQHFVSAVPAFASQNPFDTRVAPYKAADCAVLGAKVRSCIMANPIRCRGGISAGKLDILFVDSGIRYGMVGNATPLQLVRRMHKIQAVQQQIQCLYISYRQSWASRLQNVFYAPQSVCKFVHGLILGGPVFSHCAAAAATAVSAPGNSHCARGS